MRFSDSFLDEIRSRVPISSVVAPRVTWDRRKTNASRGDYWACCPFHGENSPSFHCDDRKGRYHCFGCGASGDHFRFLSEMDGLSFPESVERLAEMAGLALPARDPLAEQRAEKRAGLHEVMELAARFFEERLQAAEGARARSYLRGRGLSSAIQQRFRLGYAPGGRNLLKEHLAGQGVAADAMEACGLLVSGPDIAVSYDRFRDRIMFPILDSRGRIIAFGGRALSSDAPAKYLNSPETELFHKGEILYNFAAARQARESRLIVVEGYMDVIALAQSGFSNAVAPLGTALTPEQLALLWRASSEPVLCFDGDSAGLKAAWRAADLALPLVEPGKSVRFAILPEGKDPDDLVRDAGADAFARIIDEARPLAELVWSRQISAGPFETPEERAALEQSIGKLVRTIRNEEVRNHYQRAMREKLHDYFGGGFAARSGRGGKTRRTAGRLSASDSLIRTVKGANANLPVRECMLIAALINHPALLEEYFEQVEALELGHAELRQLLRAILEAVALDEADDPSAIREVIRRMDLTVSLERVLDTVRRTRDWPVLESAALPDARDAFAQALHLHRAAGTLHRELKEAENALAEEPSEENYRRLLDVQAQLRDAQATEALIEGFGMSSGRGMRG